MLPAETVRWFRQEHTLLSFCVVVLKSWLLYCQCKNSVFRSSEGGDIYSYKVEHTSVGVSVLGMKCYVLHCQSVIIVRLYKLLYYFDNIFRSSDRDYLLDEAGEHITGLQCGGAERWGGRRVRDLCPGHPACRHCCKVSFFFFLSKSSCFWWNLDHFLLVKISGVSWCWVWDIVCTLLSGTYRRLHLAQLWSNDSRLLVALPEVHSPRHLQI